MRINEIINEGYNLRLERDTDIMVLHITDTGTGRRTEVRGKSGYETDGYDSSDKLHQLLDKVGRTANVSDMMNGDVVTINPKHPSSASAKAATDTAFNESLDNPYPFKLEGPGETGTWVGKANTPNGPLVMDFDGNNSQDDFSIDFAVNSKMGSEGTGDAFRIFATVMAIMNDWIKRVGIERVVSFDFNADKDEHDSDGRSRLYTRYANKLAKQLGWSLLKSEVGNGSADFFTLQNPSPQKDESVTEAEDTLTLPKIKVGDEVMVGKFKNRKAEVKGFSKDDHNQPVLKTTKGDQKLFKPRISKLMKDK